MGFIDFIKDLWDLYGIYRRFPGFLGYIWDFWGISMGICGISMRFIGDVYGFIVDL